MWKLLVTSIFAIPCALSSPIRIPKTDLTRVKRELSVTGFDLSSAFYNYKQDNTGTTSGGYLTESFSEVIAKTLEKADSVVEHLQDLIYSSNMVDVYQSTSIGGSYLTILLVALFVYNLSKRTKAIESSNLKHIPSMQSAISSIENQFIEKASDDKLVQILSKLSNTSTQPRSSILKPIDLNNSEFGGESSTP